MLDVQQVRVEAAPSDKKYQYEYRNSYTQGRWVRSDFDESSRPTDWDSAIEAVQKTARSWIMGTELRLVTIEDGKEKFSDIAGKGDLATPLKDR